MVRGGKRPVTESVRQGAQVARPDDQEVDVGLESVASRQRGSGARARRSHTRERILDVALDLFTEQGYDATSLREIAERLGVTTAALYYYFPSKEDILLALHLRLHEFGKDALIRMETGPVTLELWAQLLDALVDEIVAQRPIFLLHQRNQAAVEKLHDRAHEAEHEDIQNRIRLVLGDPALPLEDRVRMAASVGIVFSGLLFWPEISASTSNEELGRLLRGMLSDVLGGR
jgi:AcrR family transcriptional regulator